MATTYKVLAQSAPSATTNTDIYTVPASTMSVLSTIVVANRAATSATYRIAVRPNGATLANQHYLAYDVTVGASDSTTITLGITMDAADVLTVYASTANLSFNVFGSEIAQSERPMPIKRLSQTSLVSFQKHSNMLAGNPAFNPNSFDLLQTTLISTNTASVTFSNLGNYSDYKHLQIRGTGRTDDGSVLYVRMNGDTSTVYSYHGLQGNGTSVSSSATSSANIMIALFPLANAGNTTNIFSGFVIDILDFSNTNKNTTMRSFGGNSQAAGFNTALALRSGLWNNTAAVTSLTFTNSGGNFVSGTRLSLYGVK